MPENKHRPPAGFAPPPKKQKKWDCIIDAFLSGDLQRLETIQRTGARGRILEVLARQVFDSLRIGYVEEPVFDHVIPASWYVRFAEKNGLKLRTHDHYNPDMMLDDGTWVEITLSENTAFKKLFRYGHQAPVLLVLWLDTDSGLHRDVCEGVEFPNAEVLPILDYYHQNSGSDAEIIRHLEKLRDLRHVIV